VLEAQQRLRSSRRLGALARVSALRRSSAKGREVRHYSLLSENAYRAELNAIRALTDARTKLVLVNSPHNPTGATFSDAEMQSLHDFLAARGIQFVVGEVITRFIMDRLRPPQRGFLMPRW